MACFSPLLACDYGINPETGKHNIKFVGFKHPGWSLKRFREFYGKDLMMLPCGHCPACADDYARTWAARIMCEAQYHKDKCFITLTYRNEPKKMEYVENDLREFIHSCRNKFGEGLKFFGCTEKGELTERKHAHLILFGVDFTKDGELIQKNGLYKNQLLDKIWNKGFCSVGSVDIASAGYVSRYCDKKKITRMDNDEKVIMSRGLGRKYFEEHYQEIFSSDYLYFDGAKFKIPRYFLKLALNHDDYYIRLQAEDYQEQKKKKAQNFRYYHNRSYGIEEICMRELTDIALSKKANQEVSRELR